jgi:hypothetical protein
MLLSQCGAAPEEAPSGAARQAILGGSLSDAPDSAVLYLQGPEGTCSAALVAPNLIVTARHCIARSTSGTFSCTAAGDLVPNDTGAGQIGADDAPASLRFFTWRSVAQGPPSTSNPDALGRQIVSTNSITSCRDDLAFVVTDRLVANVVPLPLRLDGATAVNETVSVWGYGFTGQIEPLALRTRGDAQVIAVGPDKATATPQPAPVRTVKTGPVTCIGDSGGPFLGSDGAVVAVVSLGAQTSLNGPFCDEDSGSGGTVGPRLGAYKPLATLALNVANAILAGDAGRDAAEAGSDADDETGELPADDGGEESALPSDAGGEIVSPETTFASGSGCAMGSQGSRKTARVGFAAVALALTALAKRRRKRNGSSS